MDENSELNEYEIEGGNRLAAAWLSMIMGTTYETQYKKIKADPTGVHESFAFMFRSLCDSARKNR